MRRQPMNNDADLNMLACFLVYHSIPSLKNMVASDLEGTINCWFIQRTSMNVELLVQWNTRWSSKGNTNSIPLPISVCSSHNATIWLQKYTARVIWTTLKAPIYFKRTGVTYLYYIFMHLADAFIQSDLQLHSGYTFSLVHVFPGNRTHNLLRCWRNALPLSHTGTLYPALQGT